MRKLLQAVGKKKSQQADTERGLKLELEFKDDLYNFRTPTNTNEVIENLT